MPHWELRLRKGEHDNYMTSRVEVLYAMCCMVKQRLGYSGWYAADDFEKLILPVELLKYLS